MSLAILCHFLCTQHVSDINISIIKSLRLCCWITTSVRTTTQNQPHQISNTQRTENKTTDVVIQQHSRKLLMMDILISETCWVHKKWNKIASDIKLVFYSSTITMMHAPINIRGKVSATLTSIIIPTIIFTLTDWYPIRTINLTKYGRVPWQVPYICNMQDVLHPQWITKNTIQRGFPIL